MISPIVPNPTSANDGQALVYDHATQSMIWATAGSVAYTDAAINAAEDQAITLITYDGNGNAATVTEAGVVTTYTYNADGTVATHQRGNRPVRTYTYSGDNLVSVT